MLNSWNGRIIGAYARSRSANTVGTRGAAAALCGLAFCLAAGTAQAAVPTTSLLDGALFSAGGSAAADGDYDMTFSFYETNSGGTAAWSEVSKVKVVGARFSHPLGSATPLDSAKLMPLKEIWLGMKVANDPELPRQKMHAGLFALVAGEAAKLSCMGCIGSDQLSNGGVAAAKVGFNFAGSATKGGPAADVDCTGCVGVADMKFDGDVDLAGNSLKAKNGTFSGTVAAAAFVGDGSKLTGLKTPAGECQNAGEVVKGINADGTLKCIAALDPAALPKDGLNEISNNLLSNQFVDTIEGAKDVAIPDNTGADANSVLTFPDIGTTQDFELIVDVSNTDLSTLALTVLPPDDKKTGWVLCDPCGKKDEKVYKVTFNSKVLPKSGDLVKWIGANPKGVWNLKALDTSFCIPQQQGNAGICNVGNGTDGKIVSWSIKIQTLSNKKIAVAGDTYQSGTAYLKDVSAAGSVVVKGNLTVEGAVVTKNQGKVVQYRWFVFSTYANNQGDWFMENRTDAYGGVHPSNWTDGNACASSISANRSLQLGLFSKKGYGGGNANVWSEYWKSYSSTNSRKAGALFRIKNTTGNAITWTVNTYQTAWVDEDRASVSVNGANNWCPSANYNVNSAHTHSLSIPANRTSTVIFISGSTPNWNDLRGCLLAFWNNSLNLPNGLEYVDDLDTAADGWDN